MQLPSGVFVVVIERRVVDREGTDGFMSLDDKVIPPIEVKAAKTDVEQRRGVRLISVVVVSNPERVLGPINI